MIIFDTETTGLPKAIASNNRHQPKIIEFAAIKLSDDDFRETDRIQFLINPKRKIPPEIIKITNITDSMLKDASFFEDKIDEIVSFFSGENNLIAHNLAFDKLMLELEFERAGRDDFEMPKNLICTVEQSFHIKGFRLKQSALFDLATDGLEFSGAHRAMNDVEALCTCALWMIDNNYIELK
tara:strand:- start:2976 stop:3521 length:546 start_codon:yes stop_codon:yes gene_type:complete